MLHSPIVGPLIAGLFASAQRTHAFLWEFVRALKQSRAHWVPTIILSALGALALSVQAAEYHVSGSGDDGNPGSAARPFKTITAAANAAGPGDVVTVHEGLYRERINPPRGGRSDDSRIVYRAAPGEEVTIKGSERIRDWQKVRDDVWKVTLPNNFFADYNPYTTVIQGEWHHHKGYPRHTGTVYVNGEWMDEARSLDQLLPQAKPAAPQRRVLGGQAARYPEKPIAQTEDDVLYRTCRYNLQGYRLAVPNGSYRVTLKFCEPHFDAKTKRVLDVKLQGKTVLSDFDIFARVGKFAAQDEHFEEIAVTDGELKIDIINRRSMACISGIVVANANFASKINCGGPRWNGYEPDPEPAGNTVVAGRPLWKAQVDEATTTIWAQFGDLDPNKELVEINVRPSVFYPDKPSRNYITVRGFTMRHAATPWSGAMSEQVGLIGTHWSKGWVIEDNIISHSMNTGITLGRYDLIAYGLAMPPATAPGFVKSCELAIEHGWSKQNIGSHIVRNNRISHCEKNGIHGSLGGIFSTIEGNTICDIATRGWIGGPDVAGLKLLASNDVIIRGNHIYRCGAVGGVWLDWMAQGTRMTGNLLHDNSKDLFMEVNHGPFLIDNNLFLSRNAVAEWSQGGAFAHNLIAGSITHRKEKRETPWFSPHSVRHMRLSNIQHKDQRYYNNLFVGSRGLSVYGEKDARLEAAGNVHSASVKLAEKADGWWLEMPVAPAWVSGQKPVLVTTQLLGKAAIPEAAFEQPDGSPYRLDTDYSGNPRNAENPAPGPFEFGSAMNLRVKVWPKY